MKQYIPILIVVISNTIYQICAKSTPDTINTFASLSVTYATGAAASVALYFLTAEHADCGRPSALWRGCYSTEGYWRCYLSVRIIFDQQMIIQKNSLSCKSELFL